MKEEHDVERYARMINKQCGTEPKKKNNTIPAWTNGLREKREEMNQTKKEYGHE